MDIFTSNHGSILFALVKNGMVRAIKGVKGGLATEEVGSAARRLLLENNSL